MTNNEIAGAVAGLIETINDTNETVKRIEAQTRLVGLRKEDICRRYLRCSTRHAAKQGRWIWPNFSESDVPGKQTWFLKTCEEWYSVPLRVHKVEYFRQVATRRPA